MSRRTLPTRTGGSSPFYNFVAQRRRCASAIRWRPSGVLRPCAGAAMVWTSPAASEALALTRVSRSCLCSTWLSPYLAKPGPLLAFAHPFGDRNDVRPLRPPSSVRADRSSPRAYPLIDVVFEPVLFGRHLTPHDAPARACACCSENSALKAKARSVVTVTAGTFERCKASRGSWGCDPGRARPSVDCTMGQELWRRRKGSQPLPGATTKGHCGGLRR